MVKLREHEELLSNDVQELRENRSESPLCADCFRQWAKFQDKDYAEKYCHSCGKSAKTTFAKPLCMACWKKFN